MSRAGAVEALVAGLVDYAGLFPPAKLDMGPAVEAFARARAARAYGNGLQSQLHRGND